MELVDMADSKSAASDSVAVQVRPLVPSLRQEADTETDFLVGFFVPEIQQIATQACRSHAWRPITFHPLAPSFF